jgi:hypothetical protein
MVMAEGQLERGRSLAEHFASLRRRRTFAFIVACGVLALASSLLRMSRALSPSRNDGLAQVLEKRGLRVDREGVLWLEPPPVGIVDATVGGVPAVVRAAPGPEEPHDIYLVMARLSPDGVLLDVGRAYNLTETSAVDELKPVGYATWFAFIEQPLSSSAEERPSRFRLVDLAAPVEGASTDWTPLQRFQGALTRLQQTGRLDGARLTTFAIEPAPSELRLGVVHDKLSVTADARTAIVPPDRPLEVPDWLSVEPLAERKPGSLVTWGVDLVREEIGDEAMQYIKAVAFSALDLVLSGKEDLTGDDAAEEIAADLGEDSLAEPTKAIVVDPDIGFPPPRLDPWVKPALPGEGEWTGKDDDEFVHTLPGLPPTFVTTFIRGDQRRKTTRVYIVLWDPRLVQLNTMAGQAEPKSATGATGPGLIPREPKVMRRLAAAMNAGFQALHGEFGMMSDGVVYLPPKPYGATVAHMRDGSTAFGTWPDQAVIPGEMVSYRQNMTPMVVDEKFNPYGRTWWGGTPTDWEDKTHTVRTGVCLTREGFVGYFYGADLSPDALGQAMIQTRCRYGVALDMNAGHSGFEYYKVAPAAEMGDLGRPLRRSLERDGDVKDLEGWKFRARRLVAGMGLMYFPRYIQREGRDFFYLTLRDVLPGPALPKAKPWQVKGLPQHGFPYALAQTEIKLGKASARVLKIDPRMLTADRASAATHEGSPTTVATVNPVGQPMAGKPSLWWSPSAFAISETPLVEEAVHLATGEPMGDAPAAVGVELEGGMLIYVELADGARASTKDINGLFESMGAPHPLLLTAPLALAIGGDTDITGSAYRQPRSPKEVRMLRQAGPGGRTIFDGTPVVPMKTWYPLQARRIRYFKKDTDT